MKNGVDSAAVTAHFDSIAGDYDGWKEKSAYYYRSVQEGLRHFVPAGRRVLELGCGTGAILDSLQPSYGLGVDISTEMVSRARQRRPHLNFMVADAETLALAETFDFVVMVDLVEHLGGLEAFFANLGRVLAPGTVVVSSSINPLWAPVLHAAERLGLKMPEGDHRWPSAEELTRLMTDNGFGIIEVHRRTPMPKRIPWVSDFVNARFPSRGPLSKLGAVQMIVACAGRRSGT